MILFFLPPPPSPPQTRLYESRNESTIVIDRGSEEMYDYYGERRGIGTRTSWTD